METVFPEIILKQVQPDFELYELVYPCAYKAMLTIPAGFVTDFASIPKALQIFFSAYKSAVPASVLHDFFYTCHPFAGSMNNTEQRLFSDNLFRSILIEHGVSKFQAGLMYRAVRIFGKFRFDHNGRSRQRVRLDNKLLDNRIERGV